MKGDSRAWWEARDETVLARLVIGGSLRHFPAERCRGIAVVKPREFLDTISRALLPLLRLL